MNKDLIQQIVIDSVSSLKFDLVECVISFGKTKDILKVIISNKHKNITSEDCTLVADIISRRMDIDDPFERAYDLIVESPGLERELKTKMEYELFIGKELKIFINETSDIITKEGFLIGILEKFENEICVIKVDNISHTIPFIDIKKTKLYCDYDKLFKKNK